MINNRNNYNILQCPDCYGIVIIKPRYLKCVNCSRKFSIHNNIVEMLPMSMMDMKITIDRWDEIYIKQMELQSLQKNADAYKKRYFPSTYKQISDIKRINKINYLEIGCGPMYLGRDIASKCNMVIGIDIVRSALEIANTMFQAKGLKNYILIHGDILHLPIKSESIDLIYGGGVIEHFKETEQCLSELYRVLKQYGASFNTVPLLNLGSLTYRQIWGNIPNIKFVRNFYEFIHISLLKEKHMKFGFEYSFLPSTILKLHQRVGFNKILISKFDVPLVFEYVPSFIRHIVTYIAENSALFWPMIKIVAFKE